MPRALPDGLYEHVLTAGLASNLGALDSTRRASFEGIDESDAHEVLARHLMVEIARILGDVQGEGRLKKQIAIVNRLLGELSALAPQAAEAIESAQIDAGAKELFSIHRMGDAPLDRPTTPLASSTLLTRNRAEPSLGAELAREIASADRVDVIVAFISTGGIRALRSALEAFTLRGTAEAVRLRILTTVFTGTTEAKAVEELASLPGACVKISYDVRRTRLHAKAWLLHRDSGLHTAYVGSANLTKTALGSGQEWMVKVCATDLPHVIDKFRGTFEALWQDPEFEEYDRHSPSAVERLRMALKQQRQPSQEDATYFTLRPFPFQQEILDRLEAERVVHGRIRNLVVAATGTGKTVVAAFDYERQARGAGVRPRFLFLAHRKELLTQARATFRQILRDGAFGELMVDGESPIKWDYVFASIQSFASQDLIRRYGPRHFRYVVVDECHHAPAKSYQSVVPHLKPDVLLGLTATPERTDERSLLPDFDGHIAAELRIWHALERQLLVPFEYYGISDNTDLTRVRITRATYDEVELTRLYSTGEEANARADLIEKQLRDRVGSPTDIRAFAFCVSVAHADFMAKALSDRGIPALAVHGKTPDDARTDARRRLREREVNVLCTCDLFNEGIDYPFVDTLLLLRPTASATLFLQQLGRGLRHDEGKQSCLVLDFIGQHRVDFRFDNVLCALTNVTRRGLQAAVEQGFPFLPSGCVVQLDRVAQAQVLRAVRTQLRGRGRMVEDLRAHTLEQPQPTLASYLLASGRELEEIYGSSGSWTALRRQAGLIAPMKDEETDEIAAKLGQLLHIDERARLATLTAKQPTNLQEDGRRRYAMLATQLERFGSIKGAEEIASYLTAHQAIREELDQLREVLDERIALAQDVYPVDGWPLALHRHYGSREILAAIGRATEGKKNPGVIRGIFKVPGQQQELLFVTLDKSARSFSPTTRYRDRAISPTLFHWKTPSNATASQDTGRRYIESPSNGWSFFLFVRTDISAAYAFLGEAHYESHEGDKPIGITWRLDTELPAVLYDRYATLVQG